MADRLREAADHPRAVDAAVAVAAVDLGREDSEAVEDAADRWAE